MKRAQYRTACLFRELSQLVRAIPDEASNQRADLLENYAGQTEAGQNVPYKSFPIMFSKDSRKRIVFDSEILEAGNLFVGLNDGSSDAIEVYVKSFGGDGPLALTMARALAKRGNVTTFTEKALSAASLISLAGEHRVIAPDGKIVVHDFWTIVGGNAAALRRKAEAMENFRAQCIEFFEERTQNLDAVKWFNGEYWTFGATEALAAGLVHEIR